MNAPLRRSPVQILCKERVRSDMRPRETDSHDATWRMGMAARIKSAHDAMRA
jgi:hypothetical protein